jgi:hypothetical protein
LKNLRVSALVQKRIRSWPLLSFFSSFSRLLEDTVLSKRSNNVLLSLVVAAMLLFLAGCPTSTTIADINKDPARFAGKEVTIKGTTSNSFGALGKGVYEVDDGTGTMWVFSQNFGVPSGGAKVAVTGTVEQGFSFGGRSFAVVLKQTKERH